MIRIPHLEAVRRAARTRICTDCPHKTPGTERYPMDSARPCEATCPLFRHLPAITDAARTLDPMLADRPRAMRRIADRLVRSEPGRRGPVRRHLSRLLQTLEQLFP